MSSIAEAVQTLADAVARIVVEAVRRELLGEASIAAIRAAIAPTLVAEPAPQPEPKSEPVCQPANGVKTPMTLRRDFVEPADGGRDDPPWEGEDQPVDLPALPKTKQTPIIPKTIPVATAPTIKDIVERVSTASAERIKAWADGKSSAPEVKAPPPRPKPTPIVTSKVAAALANYTRQRSQVPAPVKPKASPTPEPAYDYENPNARKPKVYGGSAFEPVQIRYKPDAPAPKRGVEVMPIAGDPPPGRSALDQRRAEEAERAARGRR